MSQKLDRIFFGILIPTKFEFFHHQHNQFLQRLKKRKRLFAGGPPANKKLFAGGPPENKKLFARGPPANNKLFSGGPPANRSYLPEVLRHIRSYLLEPFLSCAILNGPIQTYILLYSIVQSCKVL